MFTSCEDQTDKLPKAPQLPRQTRTETHQSRLLEEITDLGVLWSANHAMCQNPTTKIPHLTCKGYQPHGFVWETYFLGSRNLWVSHVEVFAVSRIWHKCIGRRIGRAFVAVWCARSLIANTFQLVWRYSTPTWILDGFKFQASTLYVWWTTGEGGASTIELALWGKGIGSFSPPTNYNWQMTVLIACFCTYQPLI